MDSCISGQARSSGDSSAPTSFFFSASRGLAVSHRLALVFSSLSSGSLLSSSPVATGPKHSALYFATMGGSDLTGHFRRRRPEKWGRSRPTPCFGPAAFLRPLFASLCSSSASPVFWVTSSQNGPLNMLRGTPFNPDSSSLARKSACFGTRYVSKYTFRFDTFDGNSARSSTSAMRPAFQVLKRVSKRSPENLRFAPSSRSLACCSRRISPGTSSGISARAAFGAVRNSRP